MFDRDCLQRSKAAFSGDVVDVDAWADELAMVDVRRWWVIC
jgi:hypothetical protein